MLTKTCFHSTYDNATIPPFVMLMLQIHLFSFLDTEMIAVFSVLQGLSLSRETCRGEEKNNFSLDSVRGRVYTQTIVYHHCRAQCALSIKYIHNKNNTEGQITVCSPLQYTLYWEKLESIRFLRIYNIDKIAQDVPKQKCQSSVCVIKLWHFLTLVLFFGQYTSLLALTTASLDVSSET